MTKKVDNYDHLRQKIEENQEVEHKKTFLVRDIECFKTGRYAYRKSRRGTKTKTVYEVASVNDNDYKFWAESEELLEILEKDDE